jgi:hypothetical protein
MLLPSGRIGAETLPPSGHCVVLLQDYLNRRTFLSSIRSDRAADKAA